LGCICTAENAIVLCIDWGSVLLAGEKSQIVQTPGGGATFVLELPQRPHRDAKGPVDDDEV